MSDKLTLQIGELYSHISTIDLGYNESVRALYALYAFLIFRYKAAMNYIKRVKSLIVLFGLLTPILLISELLKKKHLKTNTDISQKRVLVITTFHNVNWFISHIKPLSQTGIADVLLVCDEALPEIDNVTFLYPKGKIGSILPRQVSKFFIALKAAYTNKPDLIVGYHMFPNALFAHLIASFTGASSCYQLTSGGHQISGGGWQSENPIAAGLQKHTRSIENLIFRIVKKIDCIVVRGQSAKEYIESIGFTGHIEIITGSVEEHSNTPDYEHRNIDLIFVGRLVSVKRPEMVISIIHKLKDLIPEIQCVFLGDGPLLENLKQTVSQLGLSDNISFEGRVSNVQDYLMKSKTFILTSEFEGVSIAMLEAMSCGVVPVVSKVGDLHTVINNHETGHIVDTDSIEDYVELLYSAITSESKWTDMSRKTSVFAKNHSGVTAIQKKWTRMINNLT